MNLELSYAEFAFLRELVSKEKMHIWKEEWLPRLKNPDEIPVLFEEWNNLNCNGIPLTNLDCCRKLQQRFVEKEKEIQSDLLEGKQ